MIALNHKTRSEKTHVLTEDKSATGHARLTCTCGATAIRQPWMKPADWRVTRREFIARHGQPMPGE